MAARLALITFTAALVAGCGATRPPGPPVGAERVLPWGAVAVAANEVPGPDSLEGHLDAGLEQRAAGAARDDPDLPHTYRILALSGGGSRGAFGAGFLKGWSATGRRPQFDVVTGISTGALIATFAFLGPEFDDGLLLYTRVGNKDIFRRGSPLGALSAPSVHDTTPMRALIAEVVTVAVVDAVAAAHASGRRLFVGTTNLESGRFTVWDLGAIAASGRPDRVEHYRDILLAATAFPVMFPPVYFPVIVDGETYWEAHVDGAARAAVFARAFMLDVEDILADPGREPGSIRSELYILYNGQARRPAYQELRPRASSVAERSVDTMLEGIGAYSADALFVMAMFTGTNFYASWIPSSIELSASPLDFDTEQMRMLFATGEALARSERPFIAYQPAPRDGDELMHIVDPDESYRIDVETYESEAGLR